MPHSVYCLCDKTTMRSLLSDTVLVHVSGCRLARLGAVWSHLGEQKHVSETGRLRCPEVDINQYSQATCRGDYFSPSVPYHCFVFKFSFTVCCAFFYNWNMLWLVCSFIIIESYAIIHITWFSLHKWSVIADLLQIFAVLVFSALVNIPVMPSTSLRCFFTLVPSSH